MDIRVGETPPIGGAGDKATAPQGSVEARVLAVRPPRRRNVDRPPGDPERRAEADDGQRDPLTGRVLVLLIPDGSRLPDDLGGGDYRVFLRFARR